MLLTTQTELAMRDEFIKKHIIGDGASGVAGSGGVAAGNVAGSGDARSGGVAAGNVAGSGDAGSGGIAGACGVVTAGVAGSDLPFSFVYGKRAAKDLLPAWERTFSQSEGSGGITRYETRWTDPATGLEAACLAASYPDFAAVEWTLYLKNNGMKETPILENIQGIEIHVEKAPEETYTLRTIRGENYSCASFEPITQNLNALRSARFAPVGGKPTGRFFPYFNLQFGNRGVITVVGWPGQWAATFNIPYLAYSPVSISAGQELTCLSLRPGEEIRTPLSLLMFYEGGYVRSQNIWRRFMIAYNMPKYGGKLAKPYTASMTDFYPSEESELDGIRKCAKYTEEGLRIDRWHMDAGWFEMAPGNTDWYKAVGTWEPDRARFPNGLRPIADAARANGMGLNLWFEPERVYKDTWLYNNHPEWLIMNDFPEWQHYVTDENNHLLDLGNPEALGWLIGHIDRLICEIGFDLFRIDICMDLLSFWRGADVAGRQGITENLYVQGFIKLLDELRRRHPDLIIDSCAGGGQRFDLETSRRSLLFTTTDYGPGGPDDAGDGWEAQQCMKYGLAQWFPNFGVGGFRLNDYEYVSFVSPVASGFPLYANEKEKELLLEQYELWKGTVIGSLYGDYYPLTEYSVSKSEWMAFQFNRPEAGEGMVLAFRRENADAASKAFKLNDLDTSADYDVTDELKKTKTVIKGSELAGIGLAVELPAPRSATIITYKSSNAPQQ